MQIKVRGVLHLSTVIKMPNPALQYTKNVVYTQKLVYNTDATGKETVTTTKQVTENPLHWNELTVKLKDLYTNASLTEIKTFYTSLSDTTYPADMKQSKLGVLKALIQIYYPKFDLSGSGTEILNRFQDKVRDEGELGVACPKCGQLHTLQPYVDLQGYIHTDPDIPIHRTPNGSNLFVCGCGNLITLQP